VPGLSIPGILRSIVTGANQPAAGPRAMRLAPGVGMCPSQNFSDRFLLDCWPRNPDGTLINYPLEKLQRDRADFVQRRDDAMPYGHWGFINYCQEHIDQLNELIKQVKALQPQNPVDNVPSDVRRATQELVAARGEGPKKITDALSKAAPVLARALALGGDPGVAALETEIEGAVGDLVQSEVDKLKDAKTDADKLTGIQKVGAAAAQAQKWGATVPPAALAQMSSSATELLQSKIDALDDLLPKSSRVVVLSREQEDALPYADIYSKTVDVSTTVNQLRSIGAPVTNNAFDVIGRAAKFVFRNRVNQLRHAIEDAKDKAVTDDKVKAAASALLKERDNCKKLAVQTPNDDGLVAKAQGLIEARDRLDMVQDANKSLGLDK
jgi:hypothetical protein